MHDQSRAAVDASEFEPAGEGEGVPDLAGWISDRNAAGGDAQQCQEQQPTRRRGRDATAVSSGAESKGGGGGGGERVTRPLTVVALSRLVYRKGIDLLALVIPEVCARHPTVRFVIGAARAAGVRRASAVRNPPYVAHCPLQRACNVPSPCAQPTPGGGGPKRLLLSEVVSRGGLEGRVTLLGPVPHERAREVLLQGQVGGAFCSLRMVPYA